MIFNEDSFLLVEETAGRREGSGRHGANVARPGIEPPTTATRTKASIRSDGPSEPRIHVPSNKGACPMKPRFEVCVVLLKTTSSLNMGNCLTVGPNEALVVSGGCCGSDTKSYIVGGWAWTWWLVTNSQRLSLEIMTLQPRCEDVETAEGVAITVTGVAQVKVMTDHDLLAVACEQFLGKSIRDIKAVLLQTLEGHLRSILGTLTVEQIYQDRDQFAKLVRDVAAPDVGRMGIEILSFTIKDVYDKLDYLSSLGKTQIAAVQRDADIGVAEAERDAGIREAECKKEMMDVKFLADTKMADSKRELELQKAAFNQEVNTKKAESQLAYELQAAKEQQKIRLEEIEIQVVQRKKEITIEEKEIDRMEKELIATVKRPAEAQAYSMQQLAEGQKLITSKVAAPLAKTNEIVILSGEGSRVTGEVSRLLAELPVSINALTGVDLTKMPLLQKLASAEA
ncbi:hypothetical protein CCH79_00019656 [Gambusia affinis]|uniref:Flotillin n=1 Tax=Gambusia affinis TaxID=33528 RepID=A0A315VPP6_GAMAF|nr:hypothetical protein CCH79_00019656 [Gambusia affinis]